MVVADNAPMNADAFRRLYDYHFATNRLVWDVAADLSDEAFDQEIAYSHGSVRHQLMHLLAVDEGWFTGCATTRGRRTSRPAHRCRRRRAPKSASAGTTWSGGCASTSRR
jgi:uncharacterized damage-inducible protein DinB